jgi:hypothetical protein
VVICSAGNTAKPAAGVAATRVVCDRPGISGNPTPPRLPENAKVSAEGRTSLRHVEAAARALSSRAAERLAPAV